MGLDLHSKNLTVAVMLPTLALCALFAAKGTTNLLAGELMPLGTPVVTAVGASNEPRPPGSTAPDVTELLKRNMFDSETGPLWPPPPPDEDELPAEEATEENLALLPGQMPPACEGSLKMIASVYSDYRPEWSFATLSSGKDAPLLYRQGATIEGKEVDAIYPQAVFLKEGSKLCSLTLFDANAKGKGSKPTTTRRTATKTTPPTRPSSTGGVDQSELDKNITRVSDTNYKVNRSLVDNLLSNQAALMRSARVVPHEQNGEVVGVKLYGIRRKSVLGKLGLQNGDLLRTINGYDMSSPDSALEAYARLRSASDLSVSITRRGRPMTVEYNIAE